MHSAWDNNQDYIIRGKLCDTNSTTFLHGGQSASDKVLDNSKDDDDRTSNEGTPANEKEQHHQRQQCLTHSTITVIQLHLL